MPVTNSGMAMTTSAMTAMIMPLRTRGARAAVRCSGVAPAEREHDARGDDDGGEVGDEQQQGAGCIVGPAQLEADAHGCQGRHERDRDGHAGQGVRCPFADRDIRTGRARRQRHA